MESKTIRLQPYNNKVAYLQVLFIALTILGFEAISFFSSDSGNSSSAISIQYRFLYILVGATIIFKYWAKERYIYPNSLKVIIIYWILYLIRSLYDTIISQELDHSRILYFWSFSFLLCFVPMFPLNVTINNKTLQISRVAVLIMAIIINLISLKNNFGLVDSNSLKRLNANVILNPISYGQTGVILVIMALTSFFRQKKSEVFNFINILLIGLGLANMALAASRGPAIQMLIVFLFFIITGSHKSKLIKILLFISLLFSIVIIFRSYFYIFDSVIQRIETTSGEEERPTIFIESWQKFIDSPLLGNNASKEYAHNIFLASGEVLGTLGVILMIIIYKNAIKQSISLIKSKATDWIALLMVMQLVASLTSGSIFNGLLFWSILALSSNIYYHRYLYTNE